MIVIGNSVNRGTSVCILALLLYLLTQASGEYESREMSNSRSNDRTQGNEFGPCSDGKCIKRTTQEVTSGMWFGPRLGRRRRSDQKQETNPEIENLENVLDDIGWTLITIPGNNKRQPTQFTPRLGRASDEDFFPYIGAADRIEGELPLPPLFLPRLGRRPWTATPRLGRQLRNILRKM